MAGIAEHDSTHPRGSPRGINDHGQSTDPIIDSFRTPVSIFDIGHSQFQNSMGSIMPSSIRDPSVFAASGLAALSHWRPSSTPHFTCFIARRNEMKKKFRAALISVAFLGGPIASGTVYSGPLLKALGVSTEADAIRYYQTIDPNNQRLTQDAWRQVNGFNDPANEVIVVGGHKNTSDLGFWRRIEMVIDKRPGYVGNVAMTTFNFANEQDAFVNQNALSIVNMEYSPGPNGDRITKFYIYNANGNRENGTIFDPDLTKAENLYLPNGCASCHGGGKNFATSGGKTGGGFLAFDFNVFEYGTLTSRAANEANVKKLNQGVRMTNPPSAVKSLISGLYGGNSLPLATQNSAYRPSDWDSEPALWNVVVTDCLGCHTLSEKEVLSLDYWKINVGDFREKVLKKKLMPNSPYANRRFFNTDPNQAPTNHRQIVEDALNRFRP